MFNVSISVLVVSLSWFLVRVSTCMVSLAVVSSSGLVVGFSKG